MLSRWSIRVDQVDSEEGRLAVGGDQEQVQGGGVVAGRQRAP